MQAFTRRQFARDTLGTLVTMSLLETLFQHELMADEIPSAAARWLRDFEQLGEDLKGQKLDQVAWQKKVEELFTQVPLADMLSFIDFDRLSSGVKFIDNGALEPALQIPRGRRGAEEPGLRPANLCLEERALRGAARPQQHGHRVFDP